MTADADRAISVIVATPLLKAVDRVEYLDKGFSSRLLRLQVRGTVNLTPA